MLRPLETGKAEGRTELGNFRQGRHGMIRAGRGSPPAHADTLGKRNVTALLFFRDTRLSVSTLTALLLVVTRRPAGVDPLSGSTAHHAPAGSDAEGRSDCEENRTTTSASLHPYWRQS